MFKRSHFTSLIIPLFWALFFSFTPGAAQHMKQENLTLRIMAYNVHHCNPPSEAEKIDVEAIVETIRKQSPDLIALQEIDVMTARSGHINQAQMIAEALEMQYYFGKAIDHDGGEYGVAILSRFPMSEAQTHALPTQEGTGGEPRVLAMVNIALPDGKIIRFGSTHLDAQKDDINRLLQIHAIGEIVTKETLPIIIAGDFNAPPESEVIKVLDQHFQRSCSDCEPTVPVINPRRAIDFIAFRPETAFDVQIHEVVDESYASDHLPVFTILKIKDNR